MKSGDVFLSATAFTLIVCAFLIGGLFFMSITAGLYQ